MADIKLNGRGHGAAIAVALRWSKLLGIPSEPFVAGQHGSDGDKLILVATPLRDTAVPIQLASSCIDRPSFIPITAVLNPDLQDAAAVALAKLSSFVGLSSALNTFICSRFDTGAVHPFKVTQPGYGDSVEPFELSGS